jgi:pilus assembly protein FimV
VVSNGQYGPVEHGPTLSAIARNVAPSGVDVQQMMLALKQANPDAFYRDNINALKSGAVLRVPTSAEAQAMTIAAAAAEVRRQNSDWRAGVPGKPTIVADAATSGSTSSASSGAAGNGDRLALVPARQGSGAGTQGAGSSDKSTASLRQDLLRSQESLASLQQQSTDLKTRLKDLSDINSKNERLLSLKDNEIAELQAKLAAARKSAGMPAVAASAAKVAAAPAPAAPAPVAKTELEAAHASTAMTPAAANTPALASTAPSAPVSSATTVTTPLADSAAVKPVEPVKPAVTKPVAPAPAPVEEQPWYMQTWAWAAGAGAIVLLILLAMLGRRRKPAAAAAKSSTSLADRFGSVPGAADQDLLGDDVDQEELLDQLAEHPDDIGLHLELVSLYYSRRDVEHFEAAAEAMHAHIVDPQQDEWQDVLAMGEDLVPGHPLFAQAGQAEADEFASHEDNDGQDREALHTFDLDSYASDAEETQSPAAGSARPKVSEYHFDFNLTPPPLPQAAASDPADDDRTILRDVEPAAEPATSSWNFEEPVNETGVPAAQPHESGQFSDDPIDTKLDLARAYMDMGDADGARAMLEEVMNEGSQMQRDAAQRLIDSLG